MVNAVVLSARIFKSRHRATARRTSRWEGLIKGTASLCVLFGVEGGGEKRARIVNVNIKTDTLIPLTLHFFSYVLEDYTTLLTEYFCQESPVVFPWC